MIHDVKLKVRKRTWETMKLGAVWNFWDGEENLAESVEAIRPHVDFIALIWQGRSNYGEARTPEDITKNERLFKSLKFDEVIRFEPVGVGQDGEIQGRNQGIDLCKVFQCTHLISLGPDEIIKPDQFAMVRAETTEYDYATTCAPLDFEIFEPRGKTVRMDDFVPLIYRLDDRRRFGRMGTSGRGWICRANNSRKMETHNLHKRRIYVADEVTVLNRQGNRPTLEAYERSTRNGFYTRESSG